MFELIVALVKRGYFTTDSYNPLGLDNKELLILRERNVKDTLQTVMGF